MAPNEPLLQPIGSLIPTTVPDKRAVNDARGTGGCCHMSNNFYLTLTFGVVFTNVCIFLASFIVLLSYCMPVCIGCDGAWEHMSILTFNQKLVLYGTLLYLLSYVVFGLVCLRGLLTEERRKIVPFFFILLITELAIITTIVLVVIFGPKLLEDAKQEVSTIDDVYILLGKIFKPKIVTLIKTMNELRDPTVDADAIDYNAFFHSVFQEKFLIQSKVLQNMMIITTCVIGSGINGMIILAAVLLVKVVQRMNIFQQYLEQQDQPEEFSPDYLAYSPTHQFYSNSSSPIKANLSRQSSYRKRHSTVLRQNKEDFLIQ